MIDRIIQEKVKLNLKEMMRNTKNANDLSDEMSSERFDQM